MCRGRRRRRCRRCRPVAVPRPRGDRARSPPVSSPRLLASPWSRARSRLAAKSVPEYSSSSARGAGRVDIVVGNAGTGRQVRDSLRQTQRSKPMTRCRSAITSGWTDSWSRLDRLSRWIRSLQRSRASWVATISTVRRIPGFWDGPRRRRDDRCGRTSPGGVAMATPRCLMSLLAETLGSCWRPPWPWRLLQRRRGGRSRAEVDRSATPARSAYPSSMDALGASVAVGFNSDCPEGWIDCPETRGTGANPAVGSVYLRLCASTHGWDHNANDAESGTTMVALDGQAESAVRRGVGAGHDREGTNDACGGRTGEMTAVSVFRDEFTRAMDTLTRAAPGTGPRAVDPGHLPAVGDLPYHPERHEGVAVHPLLPNPPHPPDLERTSRHAAASRRPRSRSGLQRGAGRGVRAVPAVHDRRRSRLPCPRHRAEFSTHDYWHPNIAGQAALAKRIWDTLGCSDYRTHCFTCCATVASIAARARRGAARSSGGSLPRCRLLVDVRAPVHEGGCCEPPSAASSRRPRLSAP